MGRKGRPTVYKKDYVKQAEKLCALGATDAEIADFFEVDRVTIYRWKARYPDFCNALKVAKQAADARVERSLYERALGYSHSEDKIFQVNGEALIVPTEKHYPPDTTAAIFWLKNRKPREWRDRVEGADDEDGPPPLSININTLPAKGDIKVTRGTDSQ